MNPKLLNPPEFYLDVHLCETIYNRFKHLVDFSQPLPSFHDRYEHRLESILGSISQGYGETQFYPSLIDVSSGYFFKICCGNHPFANGNKRLGILYTHVYLIMHGLDFDISNAEIYGITEELAKLRESNVPNEQIEKVCRIVIETHVIDLDRMKKI